MQLTEVLCYVILTLTISSSCTSEEHHSIKIERSNPRQKQRMIKRSHNALIDNFPIEVMYYQPKTIYKRVQKQRYRRTKPLHGPPRSKYNVPVPTPNTRSNQHYKKYRGKPLNPKYGKMNTQKQNQRPGYGELRLSPQSSYRPPKANPNPLKLRPEPFGFGEPPARFDQPSKQDLDFNGNPIDANKSDSAVDEHNPVIVGNNNQFNNEDFGPEYNIWKSLQSDNIPSNSKTQPTYIKPDEDPFEVVPPGADVVIDDFNINAQSDLPTFSPFSKDSMDSKKIHMNNKFVSRPWQSNVKLMKPPFEEDEEEEMVVGGQYAEPPARYVPKHVGTPPAYIVTDEYNLPVETEPESTGPTSTYVNYKNSNMAFSPQNLNDVFSIVDK